MKKIFCFNLFLIIFGFAFSQDDNTYYTPNKKIAVEKQEVKKFVETSKDTIYFKESKENKVINTDTNYFVESRKIVSKENRQITSEEFYEIERQKQAERSKLYQFNTNNYAERLLRYGFQVGTQTIFPF